MTNIIYKRLANITFVIALSSCTTVPVSPPKPCCPVPTSPQTSTPTPINTSAQKIGDYYASNITGDYADSAALQSFIQYMVQKYGFSEHYLNGLFSKAVYLESVARLEEPPKTNIYMVSNASHSGSWSRYRQQFLDPAHINKGVEFWHNNAAALQKASATYGVDPEYIVAIIGVETNFGRNVGKTRTIDALTTLAFDTERRSKYFTTELEHFLLISREEGYDPRQIKGSWAGAMGLGQFMPSSFRNLAVDFNNDGKRDLWQADDAIGSVANYFSHHGWQLNAAVAEQTEQTDAFSTIELSTYSGSEFWAVYPNFKVIKKYNNSDKYAMAVYQLAQACKERY